MGKYKVVSKRFNIKKNLVEYHLVQMGTWDFFDDFLKVFNKHHKVKIEKSLDGIFTRKYTLSRDNITFEFEHHEDIGNWFYSTSKEAHPFLEKLALNLESMFCHIPYGKSGNLS